MMPRFVWRLVDLWHDPMAFLGLQTERHQGSPVNYHTRNAPVARQRSIGHHKLLAAIQTGPLFPAPQNPQEWVDPPLHEEGTVLEECPDCEDGFDHSGALMRLCSSCGGYYYRPHEDD